MRFLNLLFLLSVFFFGFTVLWPLLPEVDFAAFKARSFVRSRVFSESSRNTSQQTNTSENYLYIPIINVNSAIVEGLTEEALNKGVWHRPKTSTPDIPGNTVLTGHRFLYTGFANNTFYNLDKLRVGDEVYINWNRTEYRYLVTEKKIVEPTAIEIEKDFGDRRLTLYTCHPLWTADKRLVVIAKPVVE